MKKWWGRQGQSFVGEPLPERRAIPPADQLIPPIGNQLASMPSGTPFVAVAAIAGVKRADGNTFTADELRRLADDVTWIWSEERQALLYKGTVP